MSLIKDISSGDNVKIFEFEKNENFPNILQTFLKNIDIKRDLRKNFYKGYVGVAKIMSSLKGINDYSDTVQYATNKKGIEVEIFTGQNKIFLVIHYVEESEKQYKALYNFAPIPYHSLNEEGYFTNPSQWTKEIQYLYCLHIAFCTGIILPHLIYSVAFHP